MNRIESPAEDRNVGAGHEKREHSVVGAGTQAFDRSDGLHGTIGLDRPFFMYRVVITDCMPPPARIEMEVLDGIATVECLEAKTVTELTGRLTDADAVILYHEVSLNRETMQELGRCRIIARGGVGYDNVDLEAASEFGIVVTNVPDYGVDEVADHAIGLMLSLRRGINQCQQDLKRALRPWDRDAVQPLRRLAGQTFGVIGCGRIGTATAMRAKALRMRVVFFDPYLSAGMEKAMGFERVHQLEDLLKQSDVVSLHVPLTEETRRMIDADALGLMKTEAILINTARGEVVNTEALARSLEQGSLRGAGIDVLPYEPVAEDDPLVQLWRNRPMNSRLLLTPHIAYYSEEALEEIRRSTATQVRCVLMGLDPQNVVSIS